MQAAYADIPQGRALIARAAHPALVEKLRADLTASETRDSVLWLVCTGADGVIGIAEFVWGRSAAAYESIGSHDALLQSLYVVPEHWDEGVGTRLLTSGIAVLPTEITCLGVGVLSDNHIGYGFYQKYDFEKVAETELAVGETCSDIDLLVREC